MTDLATEARAPASGIPFDNSYARLPERFYVRMPPTPVSAPALVRVNRALAAELGLDADALASPAGVEILAGNRVPEGAEPLAQAYAGHQFGGWVPQLGDGRAILLGEVIGRDGVRRDIQLKGSGRTPFSRGGDGRAALGPVLREYIVSEGMHRLGIPTTRALAAVTTGEKVYRETALPGAVLTRVARSHIRVGTFQFLFARKDLDGIRALADHAIARHYPAAATVGRPYLALLEAVIAAQAALVARWLGVGFIHGVMNTDNCSIAGETIDYGPCAFMDRYHPQTVFSSIDHGGRYAFASQPGIAQWNLVQLAQCLLPVIDDDADKALEAAQAAIDGYAARFDTELLAVFRAKLGLFEARDGDLALLQDLFDRMAANQADFTLTFRRLADLLDPPEGDAPAPRDLFVDPTSFDAWERVWRARLADEAATPDAGRAAALRAANPAVIPRNHLVEEAIRAAEDAGDPAPFEALLEALATPFEERPEHARFRLPPRPDQVVRQTFCGT
ncbi:protein adenylyltransferase SelO [Thalassobaculum sp.]|uniref:protein adenylyltransferase SelO n=1 Tax=Thalassobaculum sp. TaxID=2022740 RepID=UPI0032EF35B6